jgi:hypothetical protein
MLTIQEIGHELKVNPNHVYRLIAKGLLPAVNISPGANRPTLRVTRNALVRFLETDCNSNSIRGGGIPPKYPPNVSSSSSLLFSCDDSCNPYGG